MGFRLPITTLGLLVAGVTLHSVWNSGTLLTNIASNVPMTMNTAILDTKMLSCALKEDIKWMAQAGQDKYVWEKMFSNEPSLCGQGIYVEFGARDGKEHSNTYIFDTIMHWKGLLFEVDPNEYQHLTRNRPRADIVYGAVCPRNQTHVPILFSKIPGWTGSSVSYDSKRSKLVQHIREVRNVTCYSLAEQLQQRNLHRVDYMTIDTEGSELDIVLDFPWNEFDVRVVQIEQLDARRYPGQLGRMTDIHSHLTKHGYHLLSVYEVAKEDTHDLIYVRNMDDILSRSPEHPQDGGKLVDRIIQEQRQSIKTTMEERRKERNAHATALAPWSNCTNATRRGWTAQAGQDRYLWERLFSQQDLCAKGIFVEFGARNGVEHSNTFMFETYFSWKGLLFEVDPREYGSLQTNRPRSEIVLGAVCPRNQTSIPIIFSKLPGWTGSSLSYEPKRSSQTQHIREVQNVTCYSLADELQKRNMHRVDYMTIDTEGSELDIVLDFPWNDFDIRVVQIEQLDPRRYPAQRGRMEAYHEHMTKHGYKLLSVYEVARMDTHDLIFVRNVDDALATGTPHPKDGGKLY